MEDNLILIKNNYISIYMMSGRRRIIAPDERHERRNSNYASNYDHALEQRRKKNFPKIFQSPKKKLVTDMKLFEKSLKRNSKNIKKGRFTIHDIAEGN
jgi:hypothetical protein